MESTLIISTGVLLGCLIALSWFAGSDAPYIPTNSKLIRQILKLAGAKRGKKFYELGSGDGRVVIEAAKIGADSFGVEESLLRVLLSKQKAKNLKRAKFFHGNVFSKNYQNADIVYIYLLAKGVNKLEEKLKKELKKGSIVITQTFHFPKWKPYKKIDLSKKVNLSNDIQGAGSFWFYRK